MYNASQPNANVEEGNRRRGRGQEVVADDSKKEETLLGLEEGNYLLDAAQRLHPSLSRSQGLQLRPPLPLMSTLIFSPTFSPASTSVLVGG